MKPTTHFIGRRVKSASVVHDYVQICFTDGGVLNVFNRVIKPQLDEISLKQFVQKVVTAELKDCRAFTLEFDGGHVFQIGMNDSDYRGPEALQFTDADGHIVVWS
ncbi:hypothetical protein G8O24_32525 [Bradyrhizobium sp. INPA01-394B]|uniref:Uncharacterized protein n=1 Tax=Bradyrhizobium campsiandrae TaxID=1729892 RepID=A0ABR7U7Y4_9BRAD|nr:hypothetical protein [Bradyrhizobium campsiandrae]MBC9882059.1 hypothetical protein [Bradyrhizobium campsiandrae]MBC9979680.1 hypothetical protein [Bradyrhizobium campsiandrae]